MTTPAKPQSHEIRKTVMSKQAELNEHAPFEEAQRLYARSNLGGIMPLGSPHGGFQKGPPPTGFTGRNGATATPEQLAQWAVDGPNRNVGLRLSRGLVGIDIDAYGAKHGDDTVRCLEEQWGTLPPAPYSTARGPGASGIRLFRIPDDVELAGQLPGGSVEIVQWKHRYMVVQPSVHPDTGTEYHWYDDEDTERHHPPLWDSIPWLPDTWVRNLKVDARTDYGLADDEDTAAMLAGFKPGPPCQRVKQTLERVKELFATGSAFETARSATWELVKLGTDEHHGVEETIAEVGELYALYAGERRDSRQVRSEWGRLLDGAYKKIAAEPPKSPMLADLDRCRCTTTGGVRTRATPERMTAVLALFN